MNTKMVTANNKSSSARCECSVAAISQRLFEHTLTLAEVVELSDKCGLWDVESDSKKAFTRPLTFIVPTTQAFASVSRMVEE